MEVDVRKKLLNLISDSRKYAQSFVVLFCCGYIMGS